MMLVEDDDIDFSIIEIRSSQYNLDAAEISSDGVVECTNVHKWHTCRFLNSSGTS